MLETNIQVKTDHFDGPLSLLLLLIQKEEMDIKKLDIGVITQQYLDYLQRMRELDFDVAGEYLYLASTLLLLKSKECLNEEDLSLVGEAPEELVFVSQADLINRLEELQKYRELGQKLIALPKLGSDVFKRPKVNRKTIVDSILTPMDLEKLLKVYMEFVQKNDRQYTLIRRDRLSIKEKLEFLKKFLKEGEATHLENLLECDGGHESTNIIITFISLLELARLRKIEVYQNEKFGNIYVEVRSDLASFNVDLANGFEAEETGEVEEEAKEEKVMDSEPVENLEELVQ